MARFNSNLLAATFLALLLASVASAQFPTFVSHAGSDSNPCTQAAPCASFVAAYSHSTPGGVIRCLDAGEFTNGFPLVIITAITIDCSGALGSLTCCGVNGGTDAIVVNAGATDVVTLRNLLINPPLFPTNGIRYMAGAAVHLENVSISTSGTHFCIVVGSGATSLLTMDNTTLSDCATGVFAATSSGTAVVNINNTRITNTGIGVDADNGSRVMIRDSTIYFNNFGVVQSGLGGTNLGSTVTVVNSTLGFSKTAALQSLSGEFILAFGNTFVNDVVAFNPNGGTIFTGSDNNNPGSPAGTANGGSVPKI